MAPTGDDSSERLPGGQGSSLPGSPFRNPIVRQQRFVALDTMRGLCILSVVATHFVMLTAPRVAYPSCDALRPLWLDCDLADGLSFLVINVFAVCVFGFLSGVSAALQSPSNLGKRAIRFTVLSSVGALLTSGLLITEMVEADRLIDSFAVLPFTNPNQILFPGQDRFGGLGDVFNGNALYWILAGTTSGNTFAWPFLWCVPWFLAGWLIIWWSDRVPVSAGQYLRVAALPLSLVLPDQGIVACMVLGRLFGKRAAECPSWPSSLLLAIGSVLALLPMVRLVPSGLMVMDWPSALISTLQIVAAVCVSVGLLGLLRPIAPSIYSALGRRSLLLYALHWPALIFAVQLLLTAGLSPVWITQLSIALLLINACSLPLTLGLSVRSKSVHAGRQQDLY